MAIFKQNEKLVWYFTYNIFAIESLLCRGADCHVFVLFVFFFFSEPKENEIFKMREQ